MTDLNRRKAKMIAHLAQLQKDDFRDSNQILEYARLLVGLRFQDVLDLGLTEFLRDKTYSGKKGGFGNLLEEHYFGYAANSNPNPDFENAGMELKVSPVEYLKNEQIKAGERLVISMIPNNKEINVDFHRSDLYKKIEDILLVNYLRDRTLGSDLEQAIKFVNRIEFTDSDIEIIRDDYRKIAETIQAGKAHELSEGMTNYLGACTKGATAAKSLAEQFYPYDYQDGVPQFEKAKRRAFSLKQSFMTALVRKYEAGVETPDSIAEETQLTSTNTLDSYVIGRLAEYIGWSENDLMSEFGKDLKSDSKNRYNALVWRMLGSRRESFAEFDKANIKIRVIRVQNNHAIKEHLKLCEVDFMRLHKETDWEDAEWYGLLSETKFLFAVFQEDQHGEYYFKGSCFWAMPARDLGGETGVQTEDSVYGYWQQTRHVLGAGVKIEKSGAGYKNNFMNASEHPICHLRPSAKKAAYDLGDIVIGNPVRDAGLLPDGRKMTKQAFWLNKGYILSVLRNSELA